jgi:predicted amino acid dehydrogenase
VTIAKRLGYPVTTGNSYTAAVALDSIETAADRTGIPLADATAAVVGATGAIGSVCSELLARRVGRLLVIGRRPPAVDRLVRRLEGRGATVVGAVDVAKLREADIIISATSSLATLIDQHSLRPGAVVCDIAQPPDVSAQVRRRRPDVLVIEGGLVRVPGEVDWHFDFGLPPGVTYACMAETMILALDGRYESLTLGKRITVEQVETIRSLAERHGFRPVDLSPARPVCEGPREPVRQETQAYAGIAGGGRS